MILRLICVPNDNYFTNDARYVYRWLILYLSSYYTYTLSVDIYESVLSNRYMYVINLYIRYRTTRTYFILL